MMHGNFSDAVDEDDRVRSSAVQEFRSRDGISATRPSPQEIFFQALCDVEFDICESFAAPPQSPPANIDR